MNNNESYTFESAFDEVYQDTITMAGAYNEKMRRLDDGDSVTTLYSHTFKARVTRALLLTFELSDRQFAALVLVISKLLQIDDQCNCLLDEIKMIPSVEQEIVFYRKSLNGVSILSVDSDGDILINFTGFKTGFKTDSYPFSTGIDFESLIYKFLSR